MSIFTPPSPPARVPAQIEFTPADSTRRRHPGARSQRTAHSRSHAHAQRTYRIGLRTPSIYTYRSTSARHTLVQASRTCGAPRPPVAGSQIPPWAMRSVTARTPCLVCTNAHIRSTLNINSTRAADIFICTPPSLPDTLLCTIKQGQRHPGTIQIYIRDIRPCLRTSMQDVHPFVFVASTARGDGNGSRHRADARISASVHHHVQTPHECLISLMFIRQITKA